MRFSAERPGGSGHVSIALNPPHLSRALLLWVRLGNRSAVRWPASLCRGAQDWTLLAACAAARRSRPSLPPQLPPNGPEFTAPDDAPLKTQQVRRARTAPAQPPQRCARVPAGVKP
jgi:hypothetical protein